VSPDKELDLEEAVTVDADADLEVEAELTFLASFRRDLG